MTGWIGDLQVTGSHCKLLWNEGRVAMVVGRVVVGGEAALTWFRQSWFHVDFSKGVHWLVDAVVPFFFFPSPSVRKTVTWWDWRERAMVVAWDTGLGFPGRPPSRSSSEFLSVLLEDPSSLWKGYSMGQWFLGIWTIYRKWWMDGCVGA